MQETRKQGTSICIPATVREQPHTLTLTRKLAHFDTCSWLKAELNAARAEPRGRRVLGSRPTSSSALRLGSELALAPRRTAASEASPS